MRFDHEPCDWWQGTVIYQVYPRSFYDSNGDGIGDLPGVINKLEYIASLGVEAIWLCPFFTSPQKDFGYDVSDYLMVDPVFGTLADFDVLVARAHALRLKVLIDQVWCHTSSQHAWFAQSRVSRTNARADWYAWADPAPDGMPPNNWLSVFGGSAWSWEPRRHQYYLHRFLSDQPALNHLNPAVTSAIIEVGKFWLDRGVDGFRLDAVDFLTYDQELRSNPAAPVSSIPTKLFGMQEHQWDVLRPERFGVLGKIRDLMDTYPGTITIGEVSSQPGSFDRVIDYTSGSDCLHMAYTLGIMRGDFGWKMMSDLLRKITEKADCGHVCWSFSNHDTVRAISRWKPKHLDNRVFGRLLMNLLVCLPGSICIYQGEELGLTEADLHFDDLRDPFGITYWPQFKGRDGSRTPIPWSPCSGSQSVPSWLPIPEAHHRLAVAEQEQDACAMLNDWRKAVTLRNSQPALRHGSTEVLNLPAPCIGFVRSYRQSRVRCVFNLGKTRQFVDMGGSVEMIRPYHFIIRPESS